MPMSIELDSKSSKSPLISLLHPFHFPHTLSLSPTLSLSLVLAGRPWRRCRCPHPDLSSSCSSSSPPPSSSSSPTPPPPLSPTRTSSCPSWSTTTRPTWSSSRPPTSPPSSPPAATSWSTSTRPGATGPASSPRSTPRPRRTWPTRGSTSRSPRSTPPRTVSSRVRTASTDTLPSSSLSTACPGTTPTTARGPRTPWSLGYPRGWALRCRTSPPSTRPRRSSPAVAAWPCSPSSTPSRVKGISLLKLEEDPPNTVQGADSDELAAASRLEDINSLYRVVNFYQTTNPDVAKLFHVDPEAKGRSLVMLNKQQEIKLTVYGVAVLAFLDSLSGAHSDELAAASRLEDINSLNRAVNFYQTTSPDVAKLFHVNSEAKRPSLVLLNKQEEKLTLYDGEFRASAIAEFVSANKIPLITYRPHTGNRPSDV